MFKTLQEYQDHMSKLKTDPNYLGEFKAKQLQNIKDYWMDLKPFYKNEDIPEIPVTTPEEYQNFFVPILIEKGAIPKNQLIDGQWYYGEHRRCTIAKWNQKENEFDYLRYKFGYRWDTCNHFQDDDGYALFVPIRKATNDEIKEQEKIIKDNNL